MGEPWVIGPCARLPENGGVPRAVKTCIRRVGAAVVAASLVALGARVDFKSVAVGGDAFAVAAVQNADALTDYLAGRLFGAGESRGSAR